MIASMDRLESPEWVATVIDGVITLSGAYPKNVGIAARWLNSHGIPALYPSFCLSQLKEAANGR